MPEFFIFLDKKCIEVTHSANREKTTALTVYCSNGEAMDPLIIFKGKNLQSIWLGKKSLKDTYYGVSENSWMTTSIFHDWFQTFVCKVEVRPILLLFDGLLTHLSAATVELTLAENISLIQLPAHCRDVLLPLVVSCFTGFELAIRNSQFAKHFGGLRMSFCIFSKDCKSLKSDTS